MKMFVKTHHNQREVLQLAAHHLRALLVRKSTQGDVLLLCSGGSALALLDTAAKGVDASHVTIGVVDERFGAARENQNGVALRTTRLVQALVRGGSDIISVSQDASTAQAAAQQYETALRAWHTAHPEGQMIATLGMGPDGHTAGVMPFPERAEWFAQTFDNPEWWVVGYDASGKNPFTQRVTLSLAYLREHVDNAVIFVCGAQKCPALQRALAPETPLCDTPAQIFTQMKDSALFTDCTDRE